MKKTVSKLTKKLSINRETLRALASIELVDVVGGESGAAGCPVVLLRVLIESGAAGCP